MSAKLVNGHMEAFEKTKKYEVIIEGIDKDGLTPLLLHEPPPTPTSNAPTDFHSSILHSSDSILRLSYALISLLENLHDNLILYMKFTVFYVILDMQWFETERL